MDSRNLLRHMVEKMTVQDLDKLAQGAEVQVRGVWTRFVNGRLEAENGSVIDADMGEITAVRSYDPPARPMIADKGKPVDEALKTDLTPKT